LVPANHPLISNMSIITFQYNGLPAITAMNKTNQILLVGCLLASLLPARADPNVTVLLKQLQSRNIETRYAAMRGLQTSLDPRIPEACLPVLQMEGDSIRRLAARAIGSRWQGIPNGIPFYLTLVGWKSNGLEFNAMFSIKQRGEYIDHNAKLRWDPDHNGFSALPD
jgi:hypothetical protein